MIKIYDLSHYFEKNVPIWPGNVLMDVDIRKVYSPENDPSTPGFSKYTTYICSRPHVSTHMDAPIHTVPKAISVDKIPLEQCYGTGVILDLRGKVGKWDIIEPRHLETATPKIREGDIVIVNTGWHHYWKKDNYVYFNHSPGFYKEAGSWFVKKKVKMVGITAGSSDTALAHHPTKKYVPWLRDEYMRETGKDPDIEFPIHEPCHRALAEAGIPGIENVGGDVDAVAGKRCILAAFPIRYLEGDGSIIRLVAIVDEK